MNEEIKRRWISKLTSGEYPQTTGKLADDSGYCCLGVLCEIAVEDGIVIKNHEGRHAEYISKVNEEDYSSDVLPEEVVKWAGLPSNNPDVNHFDSNRFTDTHNLAELNDNGMTFFEIAGLIEENF